MWIPLVTATHNSNKGWGWWQQAEIKDGDKWEKTDTAEKLFQEWEKCGLGEGMWKGRR